MVSKNTDPKFITRMQLAERWGVSGMFIERKIREDPTFPPCTRFGNGRLSQRRWDIDAIEAYERSRVAKAS